MFHFLKFSESLLETEQPYYVKRTRNYMMPVYVHMNKKSTQVTTRVSHVIGDIWVSIKTPGKKG